MSKRKPKKSTKMIFKRWGTLAPQEHYRENDFYAYHDTPVTMGIFAFPEKFASRRDVSGPCLSNGREYYIRDENGKKVMMTYEEYCALETKEKYGRHLIVSPKYLRGIDIDHVCLGGDHGEPSAITTWTDRLRTFSYGGNIWHHLEFTNNWNHWIRTDDGIKEAMQRAYFKKEIDENYDLEGALNNIISGNYVEEYSYDESGHYIKNKRLVNPEEIICRSGSWILTNMRTYKRALEKAEHIAKYEEFMSKKAKGKVEGFPMGLPKREIWPSLFEVFIEKVE